MVWTVPSLVREPRDDQERRATFGDDAPEHVDSENVRHALSRALSDAIAAAETALRDLRKGSSRGIEALARELEEQLEDGLARLRVARELVDVRDLRQPFRVVLMGRTMAGKSTLFEVLAGGAGSRIGDGRQRFSRDVASGIIEDVGVEIVDTPGVGALDGRDDYDLAFTQVAEADLVIWVATDQAVQEQTGRALEELADLGKPLVVVVNCLSDLHDEINLEDLLEEPALTFADADAALVPVRRHLSRAAGRVDVALAVHAQAAWLGATGALSTAISKMVRERSRIDQLLLELAKQREHSQVRRRLVSLADQSKPELLACAAQAARAGRDVRATIVAVRGSRDAFDSRARARIADALAELGTSVEVSVARRERWIESIDAGERLRTINERWARELQSLRAEIDRFAQAIARRLAADLDTIAVDVHDDWVVIDAAAFAEATGRGALWANRAVKVGGRVLVGLGSAAAGTAAGALIGTGFAPVIGTAVGALVGLVAALVGVDRLLDLAGDTIFRGSKSFHERRRSQLRDQALQRLETIRVEISKACDDLRLHWLAEIEERGAVQTEIALALRTKATILARLEHSIEDSLRSIDTTLARALLHVSGRTRAANTVLHATRWRGAGLAVELPGPAAAELRDFPLRIDGEALVATSVDLPRVEKALDVLRSLHDAPLVVEEMTEERLSVATMGVDEGTREAWAALATAHARVEVHLRATEGTP